MQKSVVMTIVGKVGEVGAYDRIFVAAYEIIKHFGGLLAVPLQLIEER